MKRSEHRRHLRLIVAIAALLVVRGADRAGARGGVLDASFGDGGIVTTKFTGSTEANDAAIQDDGAIVVVGRLTPTVVTPAAMLVARYLPSGKLDPSFAGTGTVTEVIRDFGRGGVAVAIQPDGKIVVLGNDPIGTAEWFVARYDSDGTPDSTFGDGGRFTYTSSSFGGLDLALTADGQIVIAFLSGDINDLASIQFRLLRLEPDGDPDPTFGAGGETIGLPFISIDSSPAIAIGDDGKIVLAASRFVDPRAGDVILAARWLANGMIDESFGTDGVALSIAGGARGVLLRADGGLIVVGRTPAFFAFGVVSMSADGGIDPKFADGGRLILSSAHRANAIVAVGNGKLVAAGGDPDFTLVRITSSGTLDPSFGDAGTVTTSFGAVPSEVKAVVVQHNGAIVAVGTVGQSGAASIALARYVDTSTCGNGIVEDDEQCDDGNTASGDCCSAACTTEEDTDGDGLCDAGDQCPGGSLLKTARLVVSDTDLSGCHRRLVVSGMLTVSPGSTIDPIVSGLRLVLRDSGAAIVEDETLPPGRYDETSDTGWQVEMSPGGTTWRFHRPDTEGNAISRAVVRRSPTNSGRLRFILRGRAGCFATSKMPLGAAIRVGSRQSVDNPCGEIRFAERMCTVRESSRIMCRS